MRRLLFFQTIDKSTSMIRYKSLSKSLILLLTVVATVSSLRVEAAVMESKDIYNDSALWPARAALTAEWTAPSNGRMLSKGAEGVLIRLEPGSPIEALIDFGRRGLHRIPIEQTDVVERARKLSSGDMNKEFPNWSLMLGRGFSKIAPGSGGLNIEVKALLPYRHLLIVYLDDNPEDMRAVAEELAADTELYATTKTFVVVFPREDFAASGVSTVIEAMKGNGLEEIAFMAPHVSEPYARSIDHRIPGYPACVLADVEGKTLYEPGIEPRTVEAMLGEIRRTLYVIKDALEDER